MPKPPKPKFCRRTSNSGATDRGEHEVDPNGDDIMTQCALVCGAGGFIGGHLVKRLRRDGYWVRGVDLKFHEFSESEADDLAVGDLRDAGFCRAVGSSSKFAATHRRSSSESDERPVREIAANVALVRDPRRASPTNPRRSILLVRQGEIVPPCVSFTVWQYLALVSSPIVR